MKSIIKTHFTPFPYVHHLDIIERILVLPIYTCICQPLCLIEHETQIQHQPILLLEDSPL